MTSDGTPHQWVEISALAVALVPHSTAATPTRVTLGLLAFGTLQRPLVSIPGTGLDPSRGRRPPPSLASSRVTTRTTLASTFAGWSERSRGSSGLRRFWLHGVSRATRNLRHAARRVQAACSVGACTSVVSSPPSLLPSRSGSLVFRALVLYPSEPDCGALRRRAGTPRHRASSSPSRPGRRPVSRAKAVTVGLLVSLLFLGEGVLCVVLVGTALLSRLPRPWRLARNWSQRRDRHSDDACSRGLDRSDAWGTDEPRGSDALGPRSTARSPSPRRRC